MNYWINMRHVTTVVAFQQRSTGQWRVTVASGASQIFHTDFAEQADAQRFAILLLREDGWIDARHHADTISGKTK